MATNAEVKVYEFRRTTNAFNYVFERRIASGEEIIVKIPSVSANKRGINDIGWISDAEENKLRISGTFAENPKDDDALWMEIAGNSEINKTTAALKIYYFGDKPSCKIEIRAIFN